MESNDSIYGFRYSPPSSQQRRMRRKSGENHSQVADASPLVGYIDGRRVDFEPKRSLEDISGTNPHNRPKTSN